MIPKMPQSYRIPEPVRSEIIALMDDLGLVFVAKSFVRLPDTIRGCYFSGPPPVSVLDKPSCEPKRDLCADFANRNHHFKRFESVYPSDYNFENLSLDWD